jgi:nucleoside-diphosphate-sugar epimerase
VRVIVLGGTWFVGRAITEVLTAVGHAVLVVHRGISEPADLPDAQHLHAERHAWPAHRAAVAAFAPNAAIDVSAGNAAGARAALSALPPGLRLVALSSVDVYRAYEALRSGTQTDAVPLTEESPLRTTRHIEGPQWENLEIEEAYLSAGATILRLGAVYGEHDYQRRFEPVLRRVRAGRRELPVVTGSFLFSRVYAGDVAQAVVAALGSPRSAGECLNIVEAQTSPMGLFYQQAITAAGASLKLSGSPTRCCPPTCGTPERSASTSSPAPPRPARCSAGWTPPTTACCSGLSPGISITRPATLIATSPPTTRPLPTNDQADTGDRSNDHA